MNENKSFNLTMCDNCLSNFTGGLTKEDLDDIHAHAAGYTDAMDGSDPDPCYTNCLPYTAGYSEGVRDRITKAKQEVNSATLPNGNLDDPLFF